jgi:hydroxyacyl-ACP dehydratase HTD2-like protein with hotdog domain
MAEHREVTVTPDRYTTYRYAGASGDFNPIHLDDEFARSVDLPGRILHGLWTMAQVARVAGESAGDPLALRSLSVQFRGTGVPEREITITSKPSSNGVVDCEATQDGNKLVRRGKAVLQVPFGRPVDSGGGS